MASLWSDNSIILSEKCERIENKNISESRHTEIIKKRGADEIKLIISAPGEIVLRYKSFN